MRVPSVFQSVAEKPSSGAKLRRVPTQERSKRRLEAIVGAAAERFAADGFEATTMEAIALAAGTSIGSVYQFFPGKLDVFLAVAERCRQRSEATFAAALASEAERDDWETLLALAIDAFADLALNDVMFRAVFRNLHLYESFAEAEEAHVQRLIEQTASLLTLWLGRMSHARRRLVATMLVQSTSTMMLFAARDPTIRRDLIAETKRMLRRYLRPYADGDDG